MNAIKVFFQKIGDFFLDKANQGDEKRFWGNVLVAVGIVYVFTHASGLDTWVVAGGLIVLGGVFLGIAALADKIR